MAMLNNQMVCANDVHHEVFHIIPQISVHSVHSGIDRTVELLNPHLPTSSLSLRYMSHCGPGDVALQDLQVWIKAFDGELHLFDDILSWLEAGANGPEGLKFWGSSRAWGAGKHNKRVGVQPFELVNWSKIWGYHVPRNLHSLQISLRYPFPLRSCSSCGAEVQLLGWTCCNSCATAGAIYRIRKVWVTWIHPTVQSSL